MTSPKPAGRGLWTVSAREARVHAAIVAVVLWVLAGVVLLYPGPRSPFGTLKGADFVLFYTEGDIALRGDVSALYDQAALYYRQVALVPASAGDHFASAYPPQTALIFAPLAALPYGWAAFAWAALSVVAYVLALRTGSAQWPGRAADLGLMWLAAAAFPPFWNLLMHGQTTPVPLVAFALGGLCLVRDRKFLAGVALGLLAVKPQFGLVLGVVSIVCGEWRLMAGAILSVGIQAAAAALTFGPQVWLDYGAVVGRLPELAGPLESKPYQLHSLRALTQLLPGHLGAGAWAACAAVTTWLAVRVWKSAAPVSARFGLVVLASILVNPHLMIYDLTVLVLPLLWVGAWIESAASPRVRSQYWMLTYWLFPCLLFPSALLIGVQLSVVVLAVMYYRMATSMIRAVPDLLR